jgi:hypothetical protein
MPKQGTTDAHSDATSLKGKEHVLKAILTREAQGLPLNHAALLRQDRQLHGAMLRLYGSWEAAIQAAGIDPGEARIHRRWGREAIIQRIREKDALGQPLNALAVQREEATLAGAADRWFGSWYDALEAAGINPEQWRRRRPTWTRESAIEEIQRAHRAGRKLNHAAWKGHSLSRAVVDLFGGWDAALEAAGLDPGLVRVYRKPWTGEDLLAEIRRKHAAGEPLNAKDVQPNHIRRPACRMFGSWDAALVAAGLEPSRIRGNRRRV